MEVPLCQGAAPAAEHQRAYGGLAVQNGAHRGPVESRLGHLSLAAAIAVVLSVMSYFSATSAALPNLAGIVASPFRSLSAAQNGAHRGPVESRLGHHAQQVPLLRHHTVPHLNIVGGALVDGEQAVPVGPAGGPITSFRFYVRNRIHYAA